MVKTMKPISLAALLVAVCTTSPAFAASLYQLEFSFEARTAKFEVSADGHPIDVPSMVFNEPVTGRVVYDADVASAFDFYGNLRGDAVQFIELTVPRLGQSVRVDSDKRFSTGGQMLVFNNKFGPTNPSATGTADGVTFQSAYGGVSSGIQEQFSLSFTATQGTYSSTPTSLPTEYTNFSNPPLVHGYFAGSFRYLWWNRGTDPFAGYPLLGFVEIGGSYSSGKIISATPYVAAPVPLPAGLPLLAAGLSALAFLRRHRRS